MKTLQLLTEIKGKQVEIDELMKKLDGLMVVSINDHSTEELYAFQDFQIATSKALESINELSILMTPPTTQPSNPPGSGN